MRAPSTNLAGLLFDLDGTLVDTEHLHFASTAAVLRAVGHELSETAFAAFVGWSEDETWRSLIETLGLRRDPSYWAERRTAAHLTLLRAVTLEPTPGAAALLGWAAARGIPCAVASSLPRRQIDGTLDAAGLARWFKVRRSGHDDVAHGKPAPDVFLAAAAGLGVAADTCTAFEDSPVGVAAARAAGCRVVAVPCPSHPGIDTPGAHHRCASLADALAWLESSS